MAILKDIDRTVKAVREFLGADGRRFFNACYRLTGGVNPVLTQEQLAKINNEEVVFKNPKVPHPVHWREGMQVRNHMRTLPWLKDFGDHEFYDTWAEVVKKAVRHPCIKCSDPDGISIYPYYGKVPHALLGSDAEALPKEEWPENFTPDPENSQAGIYQYCLDCGYGDSKDVDVDPLDGSVLGMW